MSEDFIIMAERRGIGMKKSRRCWLPPSPSSGQKGAHVEGSKWML
jgi:hypothetical protein